MANHALVGEAWHLVLSQIDPVTYAASARHHRILMLNARTDTVVPKQCTMALWEAFGRPEIVWYDGGHYTAIRYIFDVLDRVPKFFLPGDPPRP